MCKRHPRKEHGNALVLRYCHMNVLGAEVYLEPVEDLLHSEVALQDPAVPQAPLHAVELEALHAHARPQELNS